MATTDWKLVPVEPPRAMMDAAPASPPAEALPSQTSGAGFECPATELGIITPPPKSDIVPADTIGLRARCEARRKLGISDAETEGDGEEMATLTVPLLMLERVLTALSPPPTVGAEDEAPVAWMWRHEDGTRSFVSDLDTKRIWEGTMKRVLVPVYTRPAPSADGQRGKEQGFADGYEAALQAVEVFRIKIGEPFDSSFEQHKGFVRDMLKRNAEAIRASLATDKEG